MSPPWKLTPAAWLFGRAASSVSHDVKLTRIRIGASGVAFTSTTEAPTSTVTQTAWDAFDQGEAVGVHRGWGK